MKKQVWSLITGCALFVGVQPSTFALEDISFSGYMTIKGTYTDAVQTDGSTATGYARGYASKNVNFDTLGNHIGLQASAQVSENLEMTLVLQANGGAEEYSVTTEWAYASYTINDNYTVRLGRIKGPFFMVSEYQEVGYAYPWVTPPQEVYSTNPIDAIVGPDLVYQKGLGDWDLLLELYAGSGRHKATVQANVADNNPLVDKGDSVGFETNDMVGFNTTIGTQGISFRLGYFTTKVDAAGFGITDQTGSFGGVGMIVDWRNILIYSEYIVRDTQNTVAMNQAFPDQNAGYITLGYRLGNFTPYLTAANMDQGKDKSIYALQQSSYTLGLRYEAGPTAALKIEAKQVKTDDSGGLGAYGLFDDPVNNRKGNVLAASFDLIF
ncbi:hypothetical protein MNBD_GAMMA25-1801 [hydrothermal vent metagenome]|uniref:Porin domain-containing protein n=1 Tax=hydrothermal vent metagenome TaxID=652676 RepID=A0A3B1AK70_9ZZZZ